MTLITRTKGFEIWAQFDQDAQVYQLFFDPDGETYTGWCVDSLKDAKVASQYIVKEHLKA